MAEVKQIIKDLKDLDLSLYPYDKVRNSLISLSQVGIMAIVFHAGKHILRARPNEEDITFTTREDLSYKPSCLNTTYQRASTPNQTMFYGVPYPDELPPDFQTNSRLVSAAETSWLLREKGQDGEQTLTFSRWEVTQDILLIAVCYFEDFITKNPYFEELNQAYQYYLSKLSPDKQDNYKAITDFLANEFAKEQIRNDYDYLISAIFSERIVESGKAGVIYPSVRSKGIWFNVAIHPNYVDSSMKLIACAECTIYKKGGKTIIDNETACLIQDDSLPFKMTPVQDCYRIGRNNILRELGL